MQKITAEVLNRWNACPAGFRRFRELFPDGADLKTAADALANDGHVDWSIWLFDHCRKDAEFAEQAKDGFQNTGDRNTGHQNTGHQNTGHWNTGHQNTGHFNTITPGEILVFNRSCLRAIWDECQKPDFIFNVELTYWVAESEMTDAEKAADPNFYMRGGQLRKRSHKEAWRLAWESATQEDRALVERLPNFDPDVFLEITGIDVRNQEV